jgi:redox-sensitive bicupin YhaK (pirin superfamily)
MTTNKYTLFKASSRGTADFGWLKANYYFSFANHYDPSRMGFGTLRVFNDDFVAKGSGFPKHPHNDMEIITIPLSGTVAHQDSTGGNGTISNNEVQVMTAGKGIVHSEFNGSDTEDLRLFQIWIMPDKRGHQPGYWQNSYELKNNLFTNLVNGFERTEKLFINQQASIDRGVFQDAEITYPKRGKKTGLFFVVIDGKVQIENEILNNRDWIEVTEGELPKIKAVGKADVLLIETVI